MVLITRKMFGYYFMLHSIVNFIFQQLYQFYCYHKLCIRMETNISHTYIFYENKFIVRLNFKMT